MTVLEHWFEEVWNKRNADAIEKLWVPERKVHGLAATHGGKVDTHRGLQNLPSKFLIRIPRFSCPRGRRSNRRGQDGCASSRHWHTQRSRPAYPSDW